MFYLFTYITRVFMHINNITIASSCCWWMHPCCTCCCCWLHFCVVVVVIRHCSLSIVTLENDCKILDTATNKQTKTRSKTYNIQHTINYIIGKACSCSFVLAPLALIGISAVPTLQKHSPCGTDSFGLKMVQNNRKSLKTEIINKQ